MRLSQIDQTEELPALLPDDVRAIDQIVQAMARARRLLFITGAGVSAESGLPTYRGRDGLYQAHQDTPHGLSIEEALSGAMLRLRPEITWHYLVELEKTSRHASPNRSHHVIAAMDDYFDAVWVLTQNVDGLHQRAGSRNVLDLHGSLYELQCVECGRRTTTPDYSDLTIPPRCEDCEGAIRPSVVLFGEELPPEKLARLWREMAAGFDLIFSVGTSSLFEYIIEPVRMGRSRGVPTVEINPEDTTISSTVDHKIRGTAGGVLDLIWERYLAWWPWN